MDSTDNRFLNNITVIQLYDPCVLAELIADSVDVNARNKHGNSLLHYACRLESIDPTNALLAAGADVNAQNKDGITPLHCACAKDSVKIVDALIAAGAYVNVGDKYENMPLHFACWTGGNMRIVQKLLEAGADHSIKNIDGKFPRDYASTKEIKDLLEGLDGGRATKAAI